MAIFSFAYGQSTDDFVVFRSLFRIPLQVSAARFAPHMSTRLALLLLGFLLTLSPTGKAQISAGVGVAYHDLEDVGRWGTSGAVYIPLGSYAFDVVPNIEYYYSNWSRKGSGFATDTSDVYAISADIHANLPALTDRVRPYIGSGLTYAGNGSAGALGLNLISGVYVRVQGWKFFPYGQVTYRLLPDFTDVATLDTYFFRGGVRVVL